MARQMNQITVIVLILSCNLIAFLFVQKSSYVFISRDKSYDSNIQFDNHPICNGHESTNLYKQGLGCMIPLLNVPGPARPVTKDPDETKFCSFLTETFESATCLMEIDIWQVVEESFLPEDNVLEVGARYATTSCAVSHKQNNTGKVVTVEVDPDAWPVHQFNKMFHNCAGWSLFGVVGPADEKVLTSTSQYAKQTSDDADAEGVQVTHFTWDDIENITGLKINALIFDCEGCMSNILRSFKDKLSQVDKIVIEHDGNLDGKSPDKDYNKDYEFLQSVGFKITKDFIGAWNMRHVVFQR